MLFVFYETICFFNDFFYVFFYFFCIFMKKHVFLMRNIYDCIYDFEKMVFVFYEI